MSRWIDIDDDRNCYCGCDGEYEKWSIDPDVLADAKTDVTERKKGKWAEVKFRTIPYNRISKAKRCSVCGKNKDKYVTWNFCPNCGADMRGGETNE